MNTGRKEPVVNVRDVRFDVRTHFWSARREILRGVTFDVAQGELFGFLGPNGAGKTTTIKAILGLLRPTGGMVQVLGQPIGRVGVRRRIGFMPENAYYPDHLSGRELVLQHGLLAGLGLAAARRERDRVLELVGLGPAASERLGSYSKGMLQRISFAQALVGTPELVLLDEPLSGLDPIGRREFRQIMLSLRDDGRTVFFSTHILPDVEMICSRVAILVEGEVRRVGTLHELAGDAMTGVEIGVDPVPLDTLARATPLAREVQTHAHGVTFVAAGDAEAGRIIDALRRGGVSIRHVRTLRGSLEDAFVSEATNGARRDPPHPENEERIRCANR
jgi:ABC-2 type transport system ATP-binding protein